MDFAAAQKTLLRNAAVLLLGGLFTGILVAGAMTGTLKADGHTVLAAHLSALMGSFWMAAVATSMPHLRYGPKGLSRLGWLTTIPNYANWVITFAKAFWFVKGVNANGDSKNDTIFGLLTAIVVLPSLFAGGAWVYGFFGNKK